MAGFDSGCAMQSVLKIGGTDNDGVNVLALKEFVVVAGFKKRTVVPALTF